VKCLLRHEAVGIYREGSVTIASPIDADQAASVLVAKRLVLAIGQRSVLPVLPGHDLPGVLDARLALSWAPGLGQSLGRTVVVGTRGTDLVARALQARGVQVVAVSQADALRRVLGRKRVEAVDLRGDIQPCACLVHAGPWMTEPALPFQAGAVGSLRLAAGKLPGTVSIVGSASYSDEQVPLAPLASRSESAVCPCMDVSVGELMAHLERGQTHVEVLKRSTSCGMGPCQGFPCWEHLRAVVKEATGHEVVDRPTYRPPRAGLTVAQAAALDGLLEHQ
jgi:sarcosine oxidase subunit alpha